MKNDKSNKSKGKNPPTNWPRAFGSTTQNSTIFFVAPMEPNNQLSTSYSFNFLKFKISDSLTG